MWAARSSWPCWLARAWCLLLLALGWLLVAQAQMGTAWRVGIDKGQATPLVQHGLFARSRNPIFLSMRMALLGLVLVAPSAATLVLLVAGELLMQVQVRLEEQHLAGLHGERYAAYCKRVRRWL
jgi:protein-S-isoprenylcysteine O-methyltransferase Ste14